MWTKIISLLGTIIGGVVLLFSVFARGRSSGKEEVQKQVKQEHDKAVADTAAKQVEEVKKSSEVKQEVVKKPESQLDKELEDKWTRD